MIVRPRRMVHRGSVEAIGVIVAAIAGDELTARARVLALWRPGTTVFAVAADAWFVRWPTPRRLRCERAPGLPVTVRGALCETAPLADDELAALAAPPGSLVFVRHGACEVVALARPIDPDEWLDVDAFAIVEVGSLGDPPPPVSYSGEPEPPPVRAIFKGIVGAPPPDALEVAAVLRGDLPRGREGPVLPVRSVSAARPARAAQTGEVAHPLRWLAGGGLLAALAAVVVAMPAAVVSAIGVAAAVPVMIAAAAVAHRRLRRAEEQAGKPAETSAEKSPSSPAPPPMPAPAPRPAGPPSRLRQAWKRLLERAGLSRPPASSAAPGQPPPPPPPSRLQQAWRNFLERSGLSRLAAERHAEYLRRVAEMFERGEYAEALRHAIPLGSGQGGSGSPPALGGLGPRKDLQIRPQTTPAGSSLAVDEDGFSYLRKLYRDAFDRLVRDGRIDEAAFLLAELLHADEEAVAFLERHGRARLAAELAEARGLAPGLVVRQWFLAGDRERAVLVARRRGAFPDAVARLERDPERRSAAAELRGVWADTLAAAGNYAAAVDVTPPVPENMSRIREWIDRAIELGGPAGARMLGRKLLRFPAEVGEHLDAIVALTDPDDHGRADERAQLLEVLAAGALPLALRPAARPLIRALLADAARGERVEEPRVRGLALALGDDALRVDLPPWPAPRPREPLHMRSASLRHEFSVGDAGAIAVHDVALLPDGKLLVALGELGVRLYERTGRVVWHADQPATSLVLSDHGDRAIAVAPRGRAVVRLARLDLAGRRAASWCEARLHCWAPTYDGSTWLVAEASALAPGKSRLVIVDALVDTELRALDRRDLDADVLRITHTATTCAVITAGPERWRWDLPDWTLRRREELPGPTRGTIVAGPAPVAFRDGAVASAPHDPASGPVFKPKCVAESSQGEYVAGGLLGAAPHVIEPVLHLSHEGLRHGTVRSLPDLPARVVADGGWIAVVLMSLETCLEVHIMTVSGLITRGVVALAGSRDAVVRLAGEALMIGDDRGRVLLIDLRDGALARSLRVL